MKQPQSFESLMSELESITRDLDSSLGLEDALKKYERGIELAKEAKKRLALIENRFETLTAKLGDDNESNAQTDA